MTCAWNELLAILPPQYRGEVDRLGKITGQEIRMRIGKQPLLRLADRWVSFTGNVTEGDLRYVMNAATRYSPWAAESISDGFVTAPGGHRIGICGEAVVHHGVMSGIRSVRSLNIRIARDLPGISRNLAVLSGNILIVGPPGSGKTTLLRDLIREYSRTCNVSVVDERGEIFPTGMDSGTRTDVMTGCTKSRGAMQLLRTMSPDILAMDEVTAEEDAAALLQAFNCGVRVLATVHAFGKEDLIRRDVCRKLLDSRLIDNLIIMRMDKSYRLERLNG